ncbi:hypothetical protein KSC_051560 [Ktedonobacter sp. SOSP1-52]|nr:hypothetical protein KSC_051560 [Ktedonobacter sp. SOSP1-52]
MQTLHYAIKPHGFLLLGASESVGPDSTLFTRVEQHQKVFTKKKLGATPLAACYQLNPSSGGLS